MALPPITLHAATWGALALELFFAPLALIRRLRPWVWGAMLMMHLGLIALIDFADLSLRMVMLHLFTFDPGWLRSVAKETTTVFSDGQCGLCHRVARFLAAEDSAGHRFRFAPLDGDLFRSAISAARRAQATELT